MVERAHNAVTGANESAPSITRYPPMPDTLPESLDDLYAPRAIVVNVAGAKGVKRGRGYKPVRNHRDAALSDADRDFGDQIAEENRELHARAIAKISSAK